MKIIARKHALLSALLASCCIWAEPCRFVSFGVSSGKAPEGREKPQLAVIKDSRADIVALQDAGAGFRTSPLFLALKKTYETFDVPTVSSPLLFRRKRFELIEGGALRASSASGGSGDGAWAALKDLATGRNIVAFSYSADAPDGRAADAEAARAVHRIVSAAAAKHKASVVGGGGFNGGFVSEGVLELKGLGWINAQESTPGAVKSETVHDLPVKAADGSLKGVPPEKSVRKGWFDHVFHSPGTVKPISFRLDRSAVALTASDHVPVVFRFKTADAPEGGWKAPRGLPSVTPVARDTDPSGWWMKRFREKAALVKKGDADVVFIGDSITHGWEGEGAETWKRFFSGSPFKAVNLGFSADRTEHVLWRLRNGALEGCRAKAVVLMIGTNNTGHNPFSECPPADVIIGIKTIMDVVREKLPDARIILHPIFPRGAAPDDGNRRRNDAVNRELVRFADGKGVIWCDFNDLLLEADGTLSRDMMPDLLHPGAKGYGIWAETLVPVLKRAVSAAPGETVKGRSAPGRKSARKISSALRPATRFNAVGTRGKWWWYHRMEERRRQIAASGGEFDLVMIGDSITHFWEYDYFSCGWDVYEKLRSGRRVLNLGYGGDTTANVLWRCENGELEGYRAKCVMLMIGTNNRNPPEDTAEGVRRILGIIARKQPDAKVILSSILPRGKPDDRHRAVNAKVNDIIKGFADGKKVVWLDFGGRFLKEDGTFRPKVMVGDLLHPCAGGYGIWMDAVLPLLPE